MKCILIKVVELCPMSPFQKTPNETFFSESKHICELKKRLVTNFWKIYIFRYSNQTFVMKKADVCQYGCQEHADLTTIP